MYNKPVAFFVSPYRCYFAVAITCISAFRPKLSVAPEDQQQQIKVLPKFYFEPKHSTLSSETQT